MGKKVVRHYKYKNIAAALAILLLIVLAISTSCNSNADNDRSDKKSKTDSSSSASQTNTSSAETKASFKAGKLTKNYKYINVNNSVNLGVGKLTLIDGSHAYTGGAPDDLDGVYGYLFDDAQTQVGVTSSTAIMGSTEMLEAYNEMLKAFYDETGLATIMVREMYTGEIPSDEDSDSSDDSDSNADSDSTADTESTAEQTTENSDPCYEHETGMAVDLQLYLKDEGTYPEFDGTGKYTWFENNSWKYGFILRYPEDKTDATGVESIPYHFRYVGKPYAQIMHDNNLCLEEFIEFIKDYSFENPYSFEDSDGNGYALYYTKASEEKATNCPIPLTESDEEYPYEISGDNVSGYIICARLQTASGAYDTSSIDDSTESTDNTDSTDTTSSDESTAG